MTICNTPEEIIYFLENSPQGSVCYVGNEEAYKTALEFLEKKRVELVARYLEGENYE